jgi:hypothetical protein
LAGALIVFLKEFLFSVSETRSESLIRVLGKAWFSNNELVELIPQKVCAARATVAVIYSKERTLWPLFLRRPIWWLHDVKDN